MPTKRQTISVIAPVVAAAGVIVAIGVQAQLRYGLDAFEQNRGPGRVALTSRPTVGHDRERWQLFEQDLGRGCSIDGASMAHPRTWNVRCSNRDRFILTYDRSGRLEHVVDITYLVVSSDSPALEAERLNLFENQLHGQCRIASTRMESPGTWIVQCSRTGPMRLEFNGRGHLQRVTRLP